MLGFLHATYINNFKKYIFKKQQKQMFSSAS